MNMKTDVKAKVYDALDNAMRGGYFDWINSTPDDVIVIDLITCCAELEDISENDIKPVVIEWRKERLK